MQDVLFNEYCTSKHREQNQPDATECFIALIICSTSFGHIYAHHQELETILVLLPQMVCNALVDGGRLLQAEQQAMRRTYPPVSKGTGGSFPRHNTAWA